MNVSSLIIPFILLLFGTACLFSKKDLNQSFIEGAKDGIENTVSLLPSLILLLSAISMFTASGASNLIAEAISPLFEKIGVPGELVPLLIVRPLSGSSSTALLTDLFEKYGPDSFIGICASVMSGSSDTIFYVTATYLAAAGIKKSKHLLPCAVTVMLLGIILSCLLPKLMG